MEYRDSNRRQAILVAGMHRSGTSALTRVLNLLGAELGDDLLPPRADNPSGYWEDRSVVACNDELLQALGLTWREPWPLPEGWQKGAVCTGWRQRLVPSLRQQFGGSELFVIKDPRLSRLLPAWIQVLVTMEVRTSTIICVRNPLEVADSLHARAGMPRPWALALWLTYTLEAERNSRKVPRLFVRYDNLLENWRRVVQRIGDALNIEWPRTIAEATNDVEAYLDSTLRHHNAQARRDQDQSAIGQLAQKAYALACSAATDSDNASADWDNIAAALAGTLPPLRDSNSSAVYALKPADTNELKPSVFGAWTPSELIAETLEARLYYRQHDSDLPATSHVSAVTRTHDHPMRAVFDLPDDALADFIRFDPAGMPGMYRIHAVCINGKRLNVADMRVSAVHKVRLAARPHELLCVYSDDDDPYVEFDIRGCQPPSGALRIEVVFDCDPLQETLARDVADAHKVVTEQQQQLASSLDRLEHLAAVLETRGAYVANAAAALERRQNAASRYAQLSAKGAATLTGPTAARPIRGGRWFGGPLYIRQAIHMRLHARNAETGDWWSGDEDDPQLHFGQPDNLPLEPGWYVLSFRCASLDAQPCHPVLYVDHGSGFHEATSATLQIDPSCTRQRIVLQFTKPVVLLRIDPRDGPGEFLLSDFSLRRIATAEATLRLAVPSVRALRAQRASWRSIAGDGWRLLRQHGMAGATEVVQTTSAKATAAGAMQYAEWISQCDTLGDGDREAMRKRASALREPPLISLIVPVYNTPAKLLRNCIDSVLGQIYPHWELCIANDASTAPHVRKLIDSYAAREPRIKVVHRTTNGHISAASNSAIELATGDWLALLDHDDELPEHALYHVATTVLAHPDAGLVYSDEDKIDENGNRYDPYFKPDWNPELLRSQNFICHLGVYSTKLVRNLGGFRQGYEGSQDHDLALRCTDRLEPVQIVHIPKVLYHWRATSGSTALTATEKDYAKDAAIQAVSDHLGRRGLAAAKVDQTVAGYLRVKYPLPADPPKVSLIIPTRDGVDLLRVSVGSILQKTDYPNFEIIVVDNQSGDPATLDWFEEITSRDPRVRVLKHDQPFNFSAINNAAVREATGEIVGLVNNDIEVTDGDWLREMVSHAVRDGVGAVGAKLYYPDGTIQHAGVIVGYGGVAGHAYCRMPHDHRGQMGRARLTQNIGAVTGACLLVKKSIYEEVGGMNEDLVIAFNDIDLCLRMAKAGYRNVWTPHAELTHHESATRGYEDTPEKKARFNREVRLMQRIWGDTLLADPAYNPNLALEHQPYSLASAPRTGG